MVVIFSDGSSRWKKVALGVAALVGLAAVAAAGVFTGRHLLRSTVTGSNNPADVARRVLTSVPLIDGCV